jgi:carboxyl-terminal processing protease
MNRKISAILVYFVIVFCLSQNLSAQKIAAVGGPKTAPGAAIETETLAAGSPEQMRRLETFRLVWQKINDDYFDRTFSGLNWKTVKAEFEPRVAKAASDAELHLLLQEMINRLNKSHFVIIPPEVFREIDRARAEIKKQIDEREEDSAPDEENAESEPETEEKIERATHYGIGVDIRILAEQIVITEIETDSPAARAGLKTGYVIEKINRVSLKNFLETFRKNKVYAKVYEKQTVGLLLSFINTVTDKGPVVLSVLDENDQPREFEIARELRKGEVARIVPNLPPTLLTFDAKSLSDEIGYTAFNSFALANVEKFCAAISQFKNKKALVIDLRGNQGGNFGALFGISSLLTDKGFLLGTEISKNGKEPRFIQPQLKNFKGKIVVLTDAQSYSAAEILASGLQENKRAVVIGDKTSGSALPALTQVLPTGAVFLFPIANFQTPNGNFLEGKGVEPDVKISLDRKSLLAGRDAQLDAAVNFLGAEIKKSATENVKQAGNIANAAGKNPPPPVKIFAAKPTAAEKPVQQEKALKIVDEHVAALGGAEVLSRLKSFSATGTATITQAGTKIDAGFEMHRTDANKFARVIKIEGVGEIVETFDGVKYAVQTSFMGDQKTPEAVAAEIALGANFRELARMREIYPTIVFEGAFERRGRKVNLIRAATAKGERVYFAFDAETKLLVSRAGNALETSFEDYRKVGEWLFPFTFTESIITYKLDQIKPNAAIDESRFVQKESCFSKID